MKDITEIIDDECTIAGILNPEFEARLNRRIEVLMTFAWESGLKAGVDAIRLSQKPMIEALEAARAELTIWLDCLDCDCPSEGHICGRPRVEQSLAQIDAALKREGK